jgi:hypothetical protein
MERGLFAEIEPPHPRSRLREVFSRCHVILKDLFSGGSIQFDWQKDCLVISSKPSGVE